jgi:hypothetical protein
MTDDGRLKTEGQRRKFEGGGDDLESGTRKQNTEDRRQEY